MCTICIRVAKTKALIVTAHLICVFVFSQRKKKVKKKGGGDCSHDTALFNIFI